MTETAQAPPGGPKKQAKNGDYVVLRNTGSATEGPTTWELVAQLPGPPHAAIKAAAAKPSSGRLQEGEYVAIPARSFRPVKLTTETETRVKLS